MKNLKNALLHYPRPYITDAELEVLLTGTPDSRYGKVKRLLAQGTLFHLRRGLYSLTKESGNSTTPHPFEVAQFIYGPSYISFESALNFHQLIPENVYTITSATTKRAKSFETPLGLFSYTHLPEENFYIEVERISADGYTFFIAKPWKAICDYVYCRKLDWTNLTPLIRSLRIEQEQLPALRNETHRLLDDYYQSIRITRFLKGITHER